LHHTARSSGILGKLIQAGLHDLYPEFADPAAMESWTKLSTSNHLAIFIVTGILLKPTSKKSNIANIVVVTTLIHFKKSGNKRKAFMITKLNRCQGAGSGMYSEQDNE
jgi:hypothetical protein